MGHESLMVLLIERKYPPRGDFVDVETAKIHFLTRKKISDTKNSKNAPVILIHGSSGSSADMELAFFDIFPDDIDLYAFDRPGIGWSKTKLSPLEMSNPMKQAEAIHMAVKKLKLDKPIIVGHSWGGAVAIAYAKQFGDEVSGVVSLAGVAYPWKGPHGWYDNLLTTPVINHIFTRLFLNKMGQLYVPLSINAIFEPEVARSDYREGAQAEIILRPSTIINNSFYSYNLRRHLKTMSKKYNDINTPFLIVAGNRDYIVHSKNQSERLHNEVAGSEYMLFKDTGHMPHHTQTQILADKIGRMSKGEALTPGKTEFLDTKSEKRQ
ncbi:MAG: alpha/beta fold hydrolase [Alphaproteobacteria bacterium]|nr:alpha/beta fold hydrolase [Alphaproteobacteria bacterium]